MAHTHRITLSTPNTRAVLRLDCKALASSGDFFLASDQQERHAVRIVLLQGLQSECSVADIDWKVETAEGTYEVRATSAQSAVSYVQATSGAWAVSVTRKG